jgi:hypothetical protein
MIHQINERLYQSECMQRCTIGKCKAACCLHGVWVDLIDVKDILANASLILPHMTEDLQIPEDWFDFHVEDSLHSLSGKVRHTDILPFEDHYNGTACVFLRPDYLCALQVAGIKAGLHPWRFKPFFCILHPLDFDEEGKITLDKTELLLDEEGSCLRPAAQPVPLAVTFEPELRYLLGEKGYAELLTKIQP